MRFFSLSLVTVLFCAACSAAPGKEAREQTVNILPGTYAVASVQPSSDPTCAENFDGIVGHLEYLMAQKNSGPAAVSP